jgi:hypothetical protein
MDRIGQIIEDGLSSYSNPSPRRGLETRVLRNVLGAVPSEFRFPRWVWAIPALAAGFILGVLLSPRFIPCIRPR